MLKGFLLVWIKPTVHSLHVHFPISQLRAVRPRAEGKMLNTSRSSRIDNRLAQIEFIRPIWVCQALFSLVIPRPINEDNA